MPDISTVLQVPAPLTTDLQPPAQINTTLAVGQGPAGPPGPALNGVAGATLNGHRAVAWSDGVLVHADPANPALSHSCAGVIEQAADAGTTVAVRTEGVIEFNGWAWLSGPVWFGTGGVLTQTQPTGRARVIGFGTGNKLNVCLQPPVDIAI